MRVVDGVIAAPLLCIVGGEMPRRGKEPGDEGGGALFAERLNSLFATRVNPATGRPYSLREVSDGTGGLVSRAYLSTLRRGLVAMPGLHIVEALAAFFTVPTGYFLGHDTGDVPGASASSSTDDEGATDEDVAVRLALADPMVREIALKVKDFGPEEWKLMIGMVESQMALRRLAEERARAAGASPPPAPPPASPPPRDISTACRRTKRRDDTKDTGMGGDTTE